MGVPMYDLAVIGAGWAGFNAALKAKELGLKVILIDKDQLGGTCLNLGCIPTKTLIQSAKVFSLVNKAATFGISVSSPAIDFIKVQDRKEKVIQQLRMGMQSMLNGVDLLNSKASIISPHEIQVADKVIQSKFILIASGSSPFELTQFKFDANRVLSSNEILSIKKIPDSLLVIGGGVIGCEFASLFSALGAKVTIVEKMPQLIPGLDKEVSRKIESIFKKKGIQVHVESDAETIETNSFEKILVCVGRIPQTQGLGLEALGIALDNGRVAVDEYLATNIENIYAAGDCASRVMLAHFASYQGALAVENIFNPNNRKSITNAVIPSCVFTDPQIASVGLTEDEALSRGVAFNLHKSHFLASGMARIMDETDGFIKIISNKETGEVLGSVIIGPKATELIGILTLAVSAHLNVKVLRDTIFSHPSLSEAIVDTLK